MGAANSNLNRKWQTTLEERWIFTQAAQQTDTKCISMSRKALNNCKIKTNIEETKTKNERAKQLHIMNSNQFWKSQQSSHPPKLSHKTKIQL